MGSVGCRCIYLFIAIERVLCFVRLGFPVLFRVSSVVTSATCSEMPMTLTTKEEAIGLLRFHRGLLTDWVHAPPNECNISQAVDGINKLLHFVDNCIVRGPCDYNAPTRIQSLVLHREAEKRRECQAAMLDQLCVLYQHYVGQDKIGADDWYGFELYVAQQKFDFRMGEVDEPTLQERLEKYDKILGIDVAIFEEAHRNKAFNEIQSPVDQEYFVRKCEAFTFDERYQALVGALLKDIKTKKFNKRIFWSPYEGTICSEVVTK